MRSFSCDCANGVGSIHFIQVYCVFDSCIEAYCIADNGKVQMFMYVIYKTKM